MRGSWGLPVIVLGLAASTEGAAAQPVPGPASMEPAPAPPPDAYAQRPYIPPPPYTPAPPSRGPRRGWFGTLGLGGMGYVGRPVVVDDSGGSGIAVEGLAGKWISADVAIGARLEAHTDDAERYTDSSFTAIARFPVGASGRFYLEPGLGLAFHNDESSRTTTNGIAVAMSGGYALARRRFAFDLRFGLSHARFDRPDIEQSLDHGTVWFGGALGFQ